MKWLNYAIFLVLLTLATSFALGNNHPVVFYFNLLSWSVEAPFYIWLWGAFLLGVVSCWLVQMFRRAGNLMNRHHQKKEIEALRSEISALKCEAKIRETYQDEQQDDEEKS